MLSGTSTTLLGEMQNATAALADSLSYNEVIMVLYIFFGIFPNVLKTYAHTKLIHRCL